MIQQANSVCPGVVYAANANDLNDSRSTCCVGGVLADKPISTCEGWPMCGTNKPTTTFSQPPLSCATVIPANNNADFTSKCSAASSSLASSGTNYATTISPAPQAFIGGMGIVAQTRSGGGNGASATSSGSSAAKTASSSGSGAATSGTATAASSSTPSQSSSGAEQVLVAGVCWLAAPVVGFLAVL
jgi:hypothetical protein